MSEENQGDGSVICRLNSHHSERPNPQSHSSLVKFSQATIQCQMTTEVGNFALGNIIHSTLDSASANHVQRRAYSLLES